MTDLLERPLPAPVCLIGDGTRLAVRPFQRVTSRFVQSSSARACHHVPVVTPAVGLTRLRAAAESGELDALCERHAVRVLAVSAAQ